MHSDQAELNRWIGTTRTDHDIVAPAPMASMAALLDKDPAEAHQYRSLPPLWHWLYLHSPVRQAELVGDGHPRRGDFLPPVPLPRRMWAGGRLRFLHDIPVNSTLTRTSTISDVTVKRGRSGQLVFVLVTHEIRAAKELAIVEEHDIVYREAASATGNAGNSIADPAGQAPENFDYCREQVADVTLLFRYSALTFNAHRIHYDRDYAVKEEGYSGLVVHGPLLATLLLELLRDNLPDLRITDFSFRALHPVFDLKVFRTCARQLDSGDWELWIADQDNRLCMKASARIQKPGRL
ncbi:MAG: MaoC family dehydratase N-terminal domain-containing protein [Pseudomonadales bacterium]|nr:MaoC family dehydratase N-terminal domain-containing protein [Pseudomonadales bacterium]